MSFTRHLLFVCIAKRPLRAFAYIYIYIIYTHIYISICLVSYVQKYSHLANLTEFPKNSQLLGVCFALETKISVLSSSGTMPLLFTPFSYDSYPCKHGSMEASSGTLNTATPDASQPGKMMTVPILVRRLGASNEMKNAFELHRFCQGTLGV